MYKTNYKGCIKTKSPDPPKIVMVSTLASETAHHSIPAEGQGTCSYEHILVVNNTFKKCCWAFSNHNQQACMEITLVKETVLVSFDYSYNSIILLCSLWGDDFLLRIA